MLYVNYISIKLKEKIKEKWIIFLSVEHKAIIFLYTSVFSYTQKNLSLQSYFHQLKSSRFRRRVLMSNAVFKYENPLVVKGLN